MGNTFHHFFLRACVATYAHGQNYPTGQIPTASLLTNTNAQNSAYTKCFSRKMSNEGQQRDQCWFLRPSRELQTTSSAPVHAVPCSHSPPLLDGHSPAQRTRYPASAISCSTLKNESRDLELGFKSMMKPCQGGHQDSVLSATPYPARNQVTWRIHSILKGNRNTVSERRSHDEL